LCATISRVLVGYDSERRALGLVLTLILFLQAVAKKIMDDEGYFDGELNKEMAADFKELWSDAGIQKAFHRQNEFQLTDSAA
jgi:hypothetical protein